MDTTTHKAWTAGVVSALSSLALLFFGYEMDPTVQDAVITLVAAGIPAFGLTWLIPNQSK